MEGKESLPPDFEPIKYLESEKINSIFEITKSPDWEKTIPELLETVEKYQTGKQSQTDNYPYFTSHNTAQYLPKRQQQRKERRNQKQRQQKRKHNQQRPKQQRKQRRNA